MFRKQFEIRWSDVDANGHMANSAYTNFMSHTRMAVFLENDISLKEMKEQNIGPIIFYEHTHYFKESFLGNKLWVSLEMTGQSKDGMFFKFEHNFYDIDGKNLAFCEVLGGFFDTNTRKVTAVPEKMLSKFNAFPKSSSFKELTKEDTRKYSRKPIDISF